MRQFFSRRVVNQSWRRLSINICKRSSGSRVWRLRVGYSGSCPQNGNLEPCPNLNCRSNRQVLSCIRYPGARDPPTRQPSQGGSGACDDLPVLLRRAKGPNPTVSTQVTEGFWTHVGVSAQDLRSDAVVSFGDRPRAPDTLHGKAAGTRRPTKGHPRGWNRRYEGIAAVPTQERSLQGSHRAPLPLLGPNFHAPEGMRFFLFSMPENQVLPVG